MSEHILIVNDSFQSSIGNVKPLCAYGRTGDVLKVSPAEALVFVRFPRRQTSCRVV